MEQIDLKASIHIAANKYGITPAIVWGVIMQESNANQYAARFEPAYQWLYKPKEVKPANCSQDTETILQKTSIGLMQMMGGNYREMGYKGWLTAIYNNVEAQLDYGCRFLAKKIKQYGTEKGLSAYNAGTPTESNREYVESVLKHSKTWNE